MRLQVGDFVLEVWQGEQYFAHLLPAAGLLETFGDLKGRMDEEGQLLCIGVGKGRPTELVVLQRFMSHGGVFEPSVLLIPETGTLFLGAGTRLLAYDLTTPVRLWEDVTDHGFLSWDRVGEVVLMAGELELAAWDPHGRKLWTTFVEPPWKYTLDGDHLELDVMGNVSRFAIQGGPERHKF